MKKEMIFRFVSRTQLMYLLLLMGLIQVTLLKAQNPQKGKGVYCCYNNIPNLTEQQKTKIIDLQKKHFDEMGALRDKKRNASTVADKDAISKQMADKCISHKEEVLKLLDEKQIQYFNKTYSNKDSCCCGMNKRYSGKGRGNRYRNGQ